VLGVLYDVLSTPAGRAKKVLVGVLACRACSMDVLITPSRALWACRVGVLGVLNRGMQGVQGGRVPGVPAGRAGRAGV
jgi:hypothetical protein